MSPRVRRLVVLGLPFVLALIVLAGCQAEGLRINWIAVWPLVALTGGVAARAIIPYFMAAFKAVNAEKSWQAWPRFEPQYITTFLISAVGYVVLLATVMGAFEALTDMAVREAIAVGYGLADLTRKAAKKQDV